METTDARIRAIRDRVEMARTFHGPRFDEFDRDPMNILRDQDRAWLLEEVERLQGRLGEVETALSGAHQQIDMLKTLLSEARGDKGVCCSAAGSTASSNEAKQ